MRLLESHFFLAACGAGFSALLTWKLMPAFWNYLPRDRGRAHAVNAAASVGKPIAAGVILIGVAVLSILLFVPYHPKVYALLPLLAVASAVGFVDDRSGGLTELTLGLWDLVLAVSASLLIFGLKPTQIWLPFTTHTYMLPGWLNFVVTTSVIWFSINAVNCNDGVDGLSGSLASISIGALGCLFYGVIGHITLSTYLRIPYNPDGVNWALACAVVCGCLLGYLWHNVPPANVLMGDAGSRPLGFFLGVLVVASQNPMIILFFAFTILVNGATGIVKVALLRFLKIKVLSEVRFPMHDHVRKNRNWSNTQVLARFTLAHLALTTFLFALLLKVR